MKSKIYSNQKLIGTSELQITDESMGVISGKFIPNENYKEIQKQIWSFYESDSDSKYEELNKLRINCQLENEVFLYPIGGFLIMDLQELLNEDLEFEAAGNYRHVIEDNFLGNLPKRSIFEPWEFITIEQKILYEDELFKEIGRTYFSNLLKQKNHKLCEYEFRAMAKSCANDDILFTVYKKNENIFDYAVIHLTWAGKLEGNDYFPYVRFYKDFESFLIKL